MTSGPTNELLPSWRSCIAACMLAMLGALAFSGVADAEMRSKMIDKNVCKTTGGGKFVKVPGGNGASIDRRLLADVRWIKDKFNVGFGDGYAPTGHSPQGEHPIGLAFDLFSGNGLSSGWDKIDRLAQIAEPRQNNVKLPWRWVGYDGDPGHGRGDHLHLSWAHNDRTTPRKPAKWVLTRFCPFDGGDGGGGGGGNGGGDDGGGGIGSRSAALSGLAPPAPETE